MPRTFNDSLEADLENCFFNTNEFAVTVSITREGSTTTGVAAIISEQRHETVEHKTPIRTAVRQIAIDIQATKYRINGQQTEPKSGDIIKKESTREKFQVVPAANKQCFEPTGGDGKVLRVSTNRVSSG